MLLKRLNVAIVGYKFMGKAHTLAIDEAKVMYADSPVQFHKKVMCGRNEALVREAAGILGWEEWSCDIEGTIAREDIDVVDIASPTCDHRRLALLAARHGKHILCEKPLAFNAAEALEMMQAAEAAGVRHMVAFNVRHTPAVLLAKELIESGELGELRHWRGHYLQDWAMDPQQPLVWRFQRAVAGSGSHGDLNAHQIDLARFLVGEIDEVVGMSETFVKQRPVPDGAGAVGASLTATAGAGAPLGPVDVDDATAFLARFRCGALGTFEATRFAGGHKNVNGFEINGSKGTVRFDFQRLNELEYWSAAESPVTRGFKTIHVTEDFHPTTDRYWPAGHVLGFADTYLNEFASFARAVAEDRPCEPSFYDGLQCNRVLEAVEKSLRTRAWVGVADQG